MKGNTPQIVEDHSVWLYLRPCHSWLPPSRIPPSLVCVIKEMMHWLLEGLRKEQAGKGMERARLEEARVA